MNDVTDYASQFRRSIKFKLGVVVMASLIAVAMQPFVLAQQVGTPSAIGAVDSAVLDAATRTAVVKSLAQKLISDYAYADVGAKLATAIQAKLKAKTYDRITSNEEFARALTDDLYAVAHDRHLRVNYDPRSMPAVREGIPPEALAQLRKINGAIPKVEILEGNVGYVRVNGVPMFDYSKDAIAAAFAFLKNTDALIIDNRSNGGGDPRTVALYMSYLSEGEPYVLNAFHWRKDNRVEETKTTNVDTLSYGTQKPVFVLTSKRTFSGGEELTYDVQAFKRGVVVGEVTGGGANPGGMMSLGHQFGAFIPSGYPVNPVTKGNWEGIGVKPDVEVTAEQAMNKAHILALEKVGANLTDDKQRRVLEDIAFKIKLNAEGGGNTPLLPNAEVVGEYLDASNGRLLVSVSEKDGKLLVRPSNGAELLLQLVSGNRYKILEMPGDGFVTFIKADTGFRAMVELPTGAVLADKR